MNKLEQKLIELNECIEAEYGAAHAITEVKIDPDIFNKIVIDAYRDPSKSYFVSSFRPLDAYAFSLVGIRIKPELGE